MDARNIIFQLVNTQWRQDILPQVPHHSFMDLSIIYSYVPDGILEQGSIIITNESSGLNQISKYELFDYAFVNTRRLLPPVVMPMFDIIKNAGNSEIIDNLWVISNSRVFLGAASILYKDVLYEISCKFKSDFYILPSSVHECLVIPVYLFDDASELAHVVKEVNEEHVEPVDRLSNCVYYYDRASRIVTIAEKYGFF